MSKREQASYLCTMSYVEQSVEAERRYRRGERQLYCFECGTWEWPDGCVHEGKMTYRELRSYIAKVKKEVRRRYPTQEDRLHREFVSAMQKGELPLEPAR